MRKNKFFDYVIEKGPRQHQVWLDAVNLEDEHFRKFQPMGSAVELRQWA